MKVHLRAGGEVFFNENDEEDRLKLQAMGFKFKEDVDGGETYWELTEEPMLELETLEDLQNFVLKHESIFANSITLNFDKNVGYIHLGDQYNP